MTENEEPEASPGPARPEVAAARRVVFKMGTRVLTRDDGRIALSRLFGIVEAAAGVRAAGKDVLLVSSGAVGLGCDALELESTPEDLALRQACAAIGQTRLMALYQDGFSQYGLTCAQVLLTGNDFEERSRYLSLRRTLSMLLDAGIVPIINENDVVSTEEIEVVARRGRPVFGDNDKLSALVASKLHADLLVLLTDVGGCYDKDPHRHADARLLTRVDDLDDLAGVNVGKSASGAGRGGMRSKVEAAAVAARGGCHAVVASGRKTETLNRVLAGEDVGTWFPARVPLNARHRWIAFAAAPRGALTLDAGAVEALRSRRASLLAAGVRSVEGDFRSGDVVELRDDGGAVVGRGRIPWDAPTVRDWCEGRPPVGVRNAHCLIRRNHFVLET